MSDIAALERRYRRMLLWFPAGHRHIYGEEMIGVMIASTPADQDRPSKADVLDLIGGGLRTRLRQSRAGEGNPAWRDALAVFSVVAPVVLLGWLAAYYLASIAQLMTLPRFPFWYRRVTEGGDFGQLTVVIATALAVAALAICPVLARRGKSAAAALAGVIGAAAAVFGLVQAYRHFGGGDYEFILFLSLLAAMEILALVVSAGPARGWQLLSRRGVVVLAVISFVVVAASTALGAASGVQGHDQVWNYVNTISDISGIVTVLGVALTLRRPVGGRLLALWAIPGYQFLGFAAAEQLFPSLQWPAWVAFEVEFRFLPTAVVAALVGLAVWWSGRHDRPSAPG